MVVFKRHLIVGTLTIFSIYLFLLSRTEWTPMHSWNRAYGDVSFILLVMTVVIGPLSRIHKLFYRFLSWRRELGIWCAITALLHVYVLSEGWFYWELIRLVIGVNQETGQLAFDPGFTLANLIGLVGLSYLFLLAILSNNKAVKVLGKRGWDFIQKKSGTIYLLIMLHTTFFLFFFRLGQYNWIQKPFLVIIAAVFILHVSVFILTVFKNRRDELDGNDK